MSAQGEHLGQSLPSLTELRRQHQEHEKRLEELTNKAWLTPEEEMEEKRLKKLKLRLKDQMESLRRAAS